MATLQQLSTALRNADAAGDTDAATRLAALYKKAAASTAAPRPGILRDTGQGRATSFLSNVGRGAASIVPNVVGGVGTVVGSDTLKQAGDDIEAGIADFLPVNPLYEDEFIQKAGNVAGQVGQTFATAGAGGLIGKGLGGARAINAGAQTGALAPAFLSGTRGGGKEAEKYGMTGGTAYARALLGGATELVAEKALFGLGTETAAARRLLGDTVERGAGRFAKDVGTEAGEEAFVQVAGNTQTKLMSPEGVETPGIMEGAGEAAALGAVGGSIFGGINALTPNRPAQDGQPAAQQPVAEGAPVESPTIEGDTMIPFVPTEEVEESIAPLRVEDVEDPLLVDTATKAAEAVAANVDVLPATAAALEELANEPTETPTEPSLPVDETPAEAAEVVVPEAVAEVLPATAAALEEVAPVETAPTVQDETQPTVEGEADTLPETAAEVVPDDVPVEAVEEPVAVAPEPVAEPAPQQVENPPELRSVKEIEDFLREGSDTQVMLDEAVNRSATLRSEEEAIVEEISKIVAEHDARKRPPRNITFNPKKGTPPEAIARWRELASRYMDTHNKVIESDRSVSRLSYQAKESFYDQAKKVSEEAISYALANNMPVSAEAVEELGIQVPEEYVKQGNRLVPPQAKPKPAAKKAASRPVERPRPNQEVSFRREGKTLSGIYRGQDSLGRHLVEVNGETTFTASLPTPVGDSTVQTMMVEDEVSPVASENSVEPATRSGIAVEQAQAVVDSFRRDAPKAPPVRVVTGSQLLTEPEFQKLRDSAAIVGTSPDRVGGWFDSETGTAFLVADQVRDEARAREVLIHEIVSHGGIDSVATLEEMRKIGQIINRVDPSITASVDDRYPTASEEIKLREALAKFSEAYRSADPAQLKSGWKKAWDDIKRILAAVFKRLGGDINAFDDLTLHWFYTNAARRVAREGVGAQRRGASLAADQSKDAEYLAAVQAGDMAKARQMVDAAAKAAVKPFSAVSKRRLQASETQVSLGENKVSVFRDPENGYWYFTDKGGLGGVIATNKTDAVQAAVIRLEEELGGPQPSTDIPFLDWRNDKTITLPGFYLRFGDAPKGGRSVKGNQPGLFEKGTSVLKAWRSPDGVYVISSLAANTGASDMVDGLEDRPVYIAYGEDTGEVGSDGEPLLKNVVLTEQVMNNRIVVDDPTYIDQPITNNIEGANWETITPAPDPFSALDPVTYDAQGNVIPLSQRFNPESDDIRFSIESANPENFPGTPESIADDERQQAAGVSNARRTRTRVAPWYEKLQTYVPASMAKFNQDAQDFLGTLPLEEAYRRVMADDVPDNLKSNADGRQNFVVANMMQLVFDAMGNTKDPYEVSRLRVMEKNLMQRYTQMGTGAARATGSRGYSNALIAPIAPILQTEKILIDKAETRTKARFEGGAEGATEKVNEINKTASTEASDELANQLSGEDEADVKKRSEAEKLRNKAQETAESIFRKLIRPQEPGKPKTPDPVRALYNKHLKTPMAKEEFVKGMTDLEVEQQFAETLFTTAADEIRGREITKKLNDKVRGDKAIRITDIAENRASRLIYRTEEKLRQGSKDLKAASNGDTINKAFREQVKDPKDWETFRDRLAKLDVGEVVAQRLYRTAEREAEDQQAMREFRDLRKFEENRAKIVSKDSPKLAEMLNDLRRKLYPDMNWRDIFEDLPSQQQERQKEIFTRLRLDERLRGLTTQEAVDLTNELDKAWQRERRKIFLRELNRMGVGGKTKADNQKVEKALPQLLRSINLGVFNSDMFRQAVSAEYGVRQISAQEALELRKLAEEAWQLPEGIRRTRKMREVLKVLQKTTGMSRVELLNSFWTSAVLSGMATHFDTYMAVLNGLGTNLLQNAAIMARGRPGQAFRNHLQWWNGLSQGMYEATNILLKGDMSVLKNNAEMLDQVMEGNASYSRLVPLGETLIREGTLAQKLGMAWVMVFTGRFMAAADHINNTATSYGAMAVARALHPELYQGLGAFSAEETAEARKEAIIEITGGTPPKTREEKIEVSVRTREILGGALRPEELAEASFIGDQAAYQNDPTGVFGSIYAGVNSMIGTLERSLEAKSEDPEYKNAVTRALLAVAAGGLRGLVGAKFMRFGFNFGSELTQYIPLTCVAQQLMDVYGSDLSKSRQDLLLGRNVFGLMAAATLAALFLDKEDEEEGPQINGDWSGLSMEKKKQLRSAGVEPQTISWKNADGTTSRVSYRSWPTGSIFAVVAYMADKKKYNPDKWEAEGGVQGSLIWAMGNGLIQVKNVTAMQGLAQLFQGASYSANPEEEMFTTLAKMPIRYAGGFMPNLLKDIDAIMDPRYFKPETQLQELVRNVPIMRKQVAGGRPMLNLLGDEVNLNRQPWRRVYTEFKGGPAYETLGYLLSKGLSLPNPSVRRIVRIDGANQTIESLGPAAEWHFSRILGEKYKAFLEEQGPELRKMDTKRAEKVLRSQADRMADQAEKELVKTLKK